MVRSPNTEQAEFWNSAPGQTWVTYQRDLDAMSQSAVDLLLEACAAQPGERVLDIGCGAGTSTFRLATAVGPSGHVRGVDISGPLVRRAEERMAEADVANLTFAVADAQTVAFEQDDFDLVASRFGVMFFSDPVAAFRNIANGMRHGARMAFVTWAGPETNPWFTLPQRIAIDRMGAVEPTPPDAPGPMAFRDIDRVCGILREAGLDQCRGEFRRTDLHHPGGVEAMVRLAAHVGPTARILRERNGTDEDRAAIAGSLRTEFREFESDDGIRIPAGLNIFAARRT